MIQKSEQSSNPIMDTRRLTQSSTLSTFHQPPHVQGGPIPVAAPRINTTITHLDLSNLTLTRIHDTSPNDASYHSNQRKLKFDHNNSTFTVGWDCISRFEKRGNDFYYVKTSLLSDQSGDSIVSVEEDPQRLVKTVTTEFVQTCTVIILFNASKDKMIFAHLDTNPLDKFTEWLETYGADMQGGTLFISHIDGTVNDSSTTKNEATDATRIKNALAPVSFTEFHRGFEINTLGKEISGESANQSLSLVARIRGRLLHPNIDVNFTDRTIGGRCYGNTVDGKTAEFDMPKSRF
jgi:hypothetical protein